MANFTNAYPASFAAQASSSERIQFLRRTYALTAASLLLLVALEVILFKTGLGLLLIKAISASPVGLILTLVLFIGAGYVAQMLAHADVSRNVQLIGLLMYICLEAVILAPIIYYAEYVKFPGQNLAGTAALLTTIVFSGLTATVFLTKVDFSFLGYGLMLFGWFALGLVICAVCFGIPLGAWFSIAMIGFACAAILYDTSNLIYNYRVDQHVGAALELFASIALLFYYILRLLIQTRD